MSRAQERVHDAATGLTGTLRVGYVRGYERSDLSVLMRHFHQKNGNVLISFYRCSTDVLAAGLLHQEYDIVFTWDSTNLRTQEGVTFQTVEKARLVVALYAGHPLTQRPPAHAARAARGEHLIYVARRRARFLWRRLFHAALRRGGLQAEHSLHALGGHRKHPDDGRGGGRGSRSCPTTAPTAFTMPTTSSSSRSWAKGRRKRSSPPGRAATRTPHWDGF